MAWVAPRRSKHILDGDKNLPLVAKYHLNALLHANNRHALMEDLLLYKVIIIEVPAQMSYSPLVRDLVQFVNNLRNHDVNVLIISEPSIRGRSGRAPIWANQWNKYGVVLASMVAPPAPFCGQFLIKWSVLPH